MKLFHQLIAALTLLAWLGAGVHVAVEHVGEGFGMAAHGEHHHDDDDDDAPGDSDHHHHEIGVAFAKSAEKQLLAPHWIPLLGEVIAQLSSILRSSEAARERTLIGDSPPDERASGWLLVCQTALQVRGPSLAV